MQVVLCGTNLPILGGPAFLERVKELYPRVLRVLVAAELHVDVLRTVNRGSLHRCCSSPWNPRTVRADLQDVFRQWWRAEEIEQSTPHHGRPIPPQRPAPAALPAMG